MANTKKVQDKVAIVTGGASGIGEATVLAFAENGARGVVIADIQDEKGQKLAESIGANRSTYIHCDVTDENKSNPSWNLLFNSTASSTHHELWSANYSRPRPGLIRQTVCNKRSWCCSMPEARGACDGEGVKGSVICSSSTAANLVASTVTDYIMAKCGVVALMKCASYQLAYYTKSQLIPPEMANAKKVQDKVAIVTGGASGFGEATVLAFAENGARGVVIADIQDEKGQKLAESIGTNRSTYIHCDVTDENQVKSLVDSTVQLYGQLDVIFCNAGVMSFGQQTVLDFDLGLLRQTVRSKRSWCSSMPEARGACDGGRRCKGKHHMHGKRRCESCREHADGLYHV
uniref:Uncharacterized protein n=1 Tax=Salix viminalis TaxID=40686 RepID=A0A6N2NLI3_SALVM